MLLGGYDVIYDTTGTQRTLHDSLRWTRAGGTVVMIGVNLHFMRIDLSPIWHQEVNLIGSIAHGMETWPIGSNEHRTTFSIAAELIQTGQIYPEKLITHRFALSNFKDALTTTTGKSQSRAIKVVFDYALMPATVVPNVRATARQRRPAATTTSQAMEPPVPNDAEEPRLPQEPPQRIAAPAPPIQTEEILPQAPSQEGDKTVTVPKLKRIRQIHVQPFRKTTGDVQTARETTENSTPAATNNAPDTLEEVEAPEDKA
jgi:hypothetical protein